MPLRFVPRLTFLLTHRAPVSIIIAILFIGTESGYLLSLFSLLMEQRGLSNSVIGISHSAQLSAAIVISLGLMWVMRFMSLPRAITLATLLCVVSLHVLWQLFSMEHLPLTLIIIARFMLGIAIGGLYLMVESWLNSLANSQNRGRILGIYGAFLATGLGLGPLAIPLTGTEGYLPFLVGSIMFLIGWALLYPIRHTAPTLPPTPLMTVLREMLRSPTALAATIVFGISDACLLTLVPLYGLERGFSEGQSVGLVTAGMLGTITLLIPLSMLADRVNKRRLLAWCGVGTALSAALMPFADGLLALMAVIFLWSGFFGMLFTLPLAILGEKWADANIAIASITVIMMYGIGSLLGPVLGGSAMDGMGSEGLPVFLFMASLISLGMTLLRLKRRE